MKAVILSAGESSRMYPFSSRNHKSMIKVLGKPLLEHTIEKLKNKNITDLIIVVSNNNIENYFGNGKKFGVSITYCNTGKSRRSGSSDSTYQEAY